MTQDEIIRMAREAGFTDHEAFEGFECSSEELERFAALVAAHEREKLIPKVAPDGRVSKTLFTIDDISKASEQGYQSALIELEAAVLAEREACAKVCEQIDTAAFGSERPAPNDCAAAIRARGNNK